MSECLSLRPHLETWFATVVLISILLASATSEAQIIQAPTVTGTRNEQVTINVTLDTQGQSVVAAQNDLVPNALTPIVARADGTPDCWVNPAISKPESQFGFLPTDCTGADCLSVRAVIYSAQNTFAIADGVILYSCHVLIAGTAQTNTAYPLLSTNTDASDPADNDLTNTSGANGQVVVLGQGC